MADGHCLSSPASCVLLVVGAVRARFAATRPAFRWRDVAVDLRRSSPNFGKWFGVILSGENKLQLWIPEGFAHGFLVLSESAEFLYKSTDYWYPEHERSVLWNDPGIGIDWPLHAPPNLAKKDEVGRQIGNADVFA